VAVVAVVAVVVVAVVVAAGVAVGNRRPFRDPYPLMHPMARSHHGPVTLRHLSRAQLRRFLPTPTVVVGATGKDMS
jgi:hypothetical protein